MLFVMSFDPSSLFSVIYELLCGVSFLWCMSSWKFIYRTIFGHIFMKIRDAFLSFLGTRREKLDGLWQPVPVWMGR